MFKRVLIGVAAAAIGSVALSDAQGAAQDGAIPNFSSADTGWFPISDDFQPPLSGPGPVVSDPEHPYYSNQSGKQPTNRIADLTNPILQPWVRARLKKANDDTLAGRIPFSPRETCRFAGVPGIDVFSRLRPVYFLQTAREVTIINEGDQQVRHVYMNVPHSQNVKPSWYGESVGRYDGNELVVDTIGLNDKTFVDNYLTPHTTQLHVVERFKLAESGEALQLSITVEDPGAFNMVWSARQTYRRMPQEKMQEAVCAENNVDYFGQGYFPVPQADKADF
jgi:hypothetical protein